MLMCIGGISACTPRGVDAHRMAVGLNTSYGPVHGSPRTPQVLSHIADGMCIGNILLATDGHGTFLLAYTLIREDTES